MLLLVGEPGIVIPEVNGLHEYAIMPVVFEQTAAWGGAFKGLKSFGRVVAANVIISEEVMLRIRLPVMKVLGTRKDEVRMLNVVSSDCPTQLVALNRNVYWVLIGRISRRNM
mmetsp:Transcript_7952/g.12359  ORF Transcript_7952/g.12359 Transcript_7952/m.12359 type:complete len:112 (+) Transcript_7952:915-1250(+)